MTADDFGPMLGALPVALAWLAREWWKTRSSARADAVDSANAKAQVNMLVDLERRAKEAEAEADTLRVEVRKLDGVAKDLEGELRAARRTIRMMDYRLEKADVPASERAALMTSFGAFNETPKP
jgi:predicted  nucleic acid-binding Zn-ribbon protein